MSPPHSNSLLSPMVSFLQKTRSWLPIAFGRYFLVMNPTSERDHSVSVPLLSNFIQYDTLQIHPLNDKLHDFVFFLVNSIPLHICAIDSLSSHLFLETCLVSRHCLLETVLQSTFWRVNVSFPSRILGTKLGWFQEVELLFYMGAFNT